MNGWYVVLLFAANGTGAYLAVGSGTSQVVDGVFKLRPTEWLKRRIAWARDVPASSDTDGLAQHIELADPGSLGSQYERGTVLAHHFPAIGAIDDDLFEQVLVRLLHLLGELYTHGEPDDDEEPAAQQAVHLLLKWNPVDDPDTIEKHQDAALAHDGRVWWGSFTKGDPPRRISNERVDKFRRQLTNGVDTFAYLYRLGPSPAVWKARVEQITNDRAEVDEERLPTYYGPGQQHTAYVLIREIEPFDLAALLEGVALAKKPIAGSLTPALKNQTSPMDVVHLDDITTDFTTGNAPEGLTRESVRRLADSILARSLAGSG